MQRSDSIVNLAKALAAAQGEMGHASKDETAQQTNAGKKRKYSSMAAVKDAMREPFAKNGLSITQMAECDGGDMITVETILLHETGEYFQSTISYPRSLLGTGQAGIQALGSCISYLKRYALKAMINIADDDDDDGSAAVEQEKNTYQNQQNQPQVTQQAPPYPQPQQAPAQSNQAVENAKNLRTRLVNLMAENNYKWQQVGSITGINSLAEVDVIVREGQYGKLNTAIRQVQNDIKKHQQSAVDIKQEINLSALQHTYANLNIDTIDRGVLPEEFAAIAQIENIETASPEQLQSAVARLTSLNDFIIKNALNTPEAIRKGVADFSNSLKQTA